MGLRRLRGLERPIRVGIVGAGAMGQGLAYQCAITPGFECVALADLVPERARAAGEFGGRPLQDVATVGAMHDAIATGRCAVCTDGLVVATCDAVDVLIEASSAIVPAATWVLAALAAGKPVALMNAEVDLAFGPLFLEQARQCRTTVTSIDGDQHGVLKRLVDDLELWGFGLVMAGNIKGFLDRAANPTSIIPEADKRRLDYRMCTAYTDGTKLAIEMAVLANGLGLRADVPGMHGPAADDVRQAPELFGLERMWAAGGRVVDYVLGARPDGGVFAVGHCDHPYQRQMMEYYKMGPGPMYVFTRPHHLCHVEALASVAAAVLDHEPLLAPEAGFRANVYAIAKRDLAAGEVLDGVGGYACHGAIANCGPSWQDEGLPICLAEGPRLKRAVRQGEAIALADVTYDATELGWQLYARARAAGAV